MSQWCENCRDQFPDSHHDDQDQHLAGPQYGPEGYLLACAAALRRVAERISSDGSPLAAELRSSIGDDLWMRLCVTPAR